MKLVGIMLTAGALLFTGALSAQGAEKAKDRTASSTAEVNLLAAMNSDNLGLRQSAAFELGELRSSSAVIPLMHMLHDAPDESSRIVAGLALCMIGDARGLFAVKRSVIFDESLRVQRQCAWFYNEYVQDGAYDFIYLDQSGLVDPAQLYGGSL